jgi:hypothetical protein
MKWYTLNMMQICMAVLFVEHGKIKFSLLQFSLWEGGEV